MAVVLWNERLVTAAFVLFVLAVNGADRLKPVCRTTEDAPPAPGPVRADAAFTVLIERIRIDEA